MKVWKFPIDIDLKSSTTTPISASKLLSCGQQHGILMVWALVDDDEAANKEFRVYPYITGEPVYAFDGFLGTVQIPKEFHSFEVVIHMFWRG